jgi:predicted signal transduction protein with EAL and GGDEF domain
MEALVRWRHPRRGLLTASAFVPVAEKAGCIMALGNWVLETACSQLRAWRAEGIRLDEITINLSLGQLKHGRDLIDSIQAITRKWQLQPADIEFDVTEAMLAQATWTRNDVLTRLRDLGYKIGIDNFGTEYSSFEYLHAYSVNHLKVSRVFIQDAVRNHSHVHILKAIIQLANELGLVGHPQVVLRVGLAAPGSTAAVATQTAARSPRSSRPADRRTGWSPGSYWRSRGVPVPVPTGSGLLTLGSSARIDHPSR